MDTDQWKKDRNEAFASMDKDKILAYCKKYSISVPKDETVFWAGVHKTVTCLYITEMDVISEEQYNASFDWLTQHGYKPYMK